MNTKVTLFGSVTKSNDNKPVININRLGKFCGIDEIKLEVLTANNRSLFCRATDVLLIDPISHLTCAATLSERNRAYRKEKNTPYLYAAQDITRRKISTVLFPLNLLSTAYALLILGTQKNAEYLCSYKANITECVEILLKLQELDSTFWALTIFSIAAFTLIIIFYWSWQNDKECADYLHEQ